MSVGNRGGGRPRKPLALKIAEGDPTRVGMKKLARLAAEEQERFAPGEPRMPNGLSQGARREWRKLVPLLVQSRVLSEADGQALALLCEDLALASDARLAVQKEGLRVQNGDGLKIHPLLTVIDKVSARVSAGLREFGLTPASRSRVMTTQGSDGGMEELAEILSRPMQA